MTSKKMLLAEQGIPLDGWKAALDAQHRRPPISRNSSSTCTSITCRTP